MAPTEGELEQCRAALGVAADATPEAIKQAFMQKSYALIRRSAPEAEREALRAARDRLVEHRATAEQRQQAEMRAQGREARKEKEIEQLVAAAENDGYHEPEVSPYDPRSFDSRLVNALMPPLVAGAAILLTKSPLGFLFAGFQVWVHEFGHATVAWMTGRRALPLPIGWTAVSPERSEFVYYGLLLMFVILFIAGAKEKKIVPMLAAVGLALAQFVMTWRWPEDIGYKWSVFGGVGGQFYLSAAMMGAFYFRLPDKFKWGACRYFFLFIGASSLHQTVSFWKQVKRGEEGIPYGSMIGGEEDAGGDMNILHEDYRWTQREIIHTFNDLGQACLVVLVVLYFVFVLRLDKVVARWLKPAG